MAQKPKTMKNFLILCSTFAFLGCKKNTQTVTPSNPTPITHSLNVSSTYGGKVKINDEEQTTLNGTFIVKKGDKIIVQHPGIQTTTFDANGNVTGRPFENIIVSVSIDNKKVYEQICKCTAYYYTEIN